MLTADNALNALREIKRDFANFCSLRGQVSEADTRAKLIDRVLKDVCGWPEAAITREDRVENGYTDYILSVPARKTLVVEAKREGLPFSVPQTLSQKTFKLSGALLTDAAVREAVNQVRSYCDDSGIRYALATNGYAWIIFRAIRDDMPWREGKARLFPSLENIEEHFTEFWNLLAYESVVAGSLEAEFGIARQPSRTLLRVLDRLFNADLPLQRNRLHAQLAPLIKRIFAEIADQDAIEVLQSCYVHSATLRIVADDLDCVITDSIPPFLESEGAEPLRPGPDAGRFGGIITKAIVGPSGELFLILGGIGSGKTTFLKRYQRTVGRALLDTKTLWFNIDFLKAPLDPLDLEEFVLRDILGQLRQRYQTPHLETRRNIKRIFIDDIEVLKQTALSHANRDQDEFERALDPYLEKWQQNLRAYVPGLLRLCRPKRDLAVVLFIDNVDQLPPSYQAQVFLLAERLTRLIGSATIVSLREESYYTASVQKAFTAYSNRKFHIASPRFRVLVGSRITYALDVLRRTDDELRVILPSGIAFDRTAIADFLKIVQASIFQRSPAIARFIEAICFGNMRLALQMFTTFLISGATDVDKMLYIYRRDGAYYVAYHEFVKSIMLGDRQYYKEEQSPIMNVLDCGSQRNASHFTALRILNILAVRRGESTAQGQGYVSIGDVVVAFEEAFDNVEDCVRTLNRLVARQLVEVNTRSTESVEGASHVRLTSAGWYYRRYLAGSFSYLDLVLQDTPLEDSGVEQALRRIVSDVGNLADREEQKVQRVEMRFKRVGIFLDYLLAQEDDERSRLGREQMAGVLGQRLVPEISASFGRQREWIRRRLQENRERFADETFRDESGEEEIESEGGLGAEEGRPADS